MLPYSEVDMTGWRDFVNEIKVLRPSVNIALVGKDVQLHDAYMSVVEALNHAGVENSVNVHIKWINAEEINIQDLQDVDGILVPGGFGNRGIEGKISAIHFARENNIPFLGLCLGLQCATIEFARNVCGLTDANSMEFNSDSENLVVTLMDSQHNVVSMGGTMRLGSYPCCLVPGTTAYEAYGNKDRISERHRHRFEFNSEYREIFEKEGLTVSGLSPDGGLVEIIELKEHPFFVAVQFHPEFESRPNRPHPLFAKFIKTIKELKNGEKINS
jgi:CTP synthase